MITESILLILLFALMFTGGYVIKRSLFSPWSITLLVWIVVLTLYVTVDHGLQPISSQMIYGLLLWVVPFCITSYTVSALTPQYNAPRWEPCEKNVDILTFISLILVPYATIKAFRNAIQMASPEGLFYTIREQTTNPDMYDIGLIKYFVFVVYCLFIIEANRSKIRKTRFFFTFSLCFLFFLMTMSKLTFFMVAVSSLYLLYKNKKISLKPIILFFSGFLLFAVLVQAIRGAASAEQGSTADTMLWFLAVYIVSPMQAFCTNIAESSIEWGQYTFRTFYNILHSLGYNVYVAPVIDPFVWVPLPTNVYTVMTTYFRDFGYLGIAFFSIFEGAAIGYIYKKGITGNTILEYIYTFLLVYLTLQFFDEQIFKGLSSIIYVTIRMLFCHIILNFNNQRENNEVITSRSSI